MLRQADTTLGTRKAARASSPSEPRNASDARRVLAIVNPNSGWRNMVAAVRDVGRCLRRLGGELVMEQTETVVESRELAATAHEQFDVLLVVGGDGTVCEVANGMIDNPVPMAILPTGTANLLARDFRMPREPRDMARLLARGEPTPCDVGVINDRHFLCLASIGFDAEVVYRMSLLRSGHITYLHYLRPVWNAFWKYRSPLLRIEVDGELFFKGRALAYVGNIKRHSVGVRVLNRAHADDGRLDLCVLPCESRRDVLAWLRRIMVNSHVEAPGAMYRQAQRISIVSPEPGQLVQADGDVAGPLPIECGILPRAAAFLRLPD